MFITNFHIKDLQLYREAVATWNSPHKDKLKVSNKSNAKVLGSDGSLHWFGERGEMAGFWEHFEKVKGETEKPMTKLKVGSRVRIKQDVLLNRNDKATNETAVIELFYNDVVGGVRLDKELAGFTSWNVEDLELVENPL